MRRAFVIRFPMSKPSDVSHLQTHVENRDVDPQEIVAIIAKTEGNGSLSDYSAETAEMAFTEYLSRTLAQSTEEIQARLAFFCEGGSEGVISPHGLAIGISETDDKTAKPRLAIGSARSRIIEPKEIGSGKQIEIIARCSEEAMAAAGLEDQAAVPLSAGRHSGPNAGRDKAARIARPAAGCARSGRDGSGLTAICR